MADNAANKGSNTNTIKIIRWTLGIMLMVLIAVGAFNGKTIIQKFKDNTPKEVKYEEFLKMADKKNVKKIVWSEKKDAFTFYDKDEKPYSTENPKYEDFKKDMLEKGIEVKEIGGLSNYETPIMIIVQLAMYGVFFGLLFKTSGIGAGLSDRKEKDAKSDVKFSDVAGLEEVKEDLMTVVDFLKNPDEYKEAGAEIPKGVLLYGPPGTGKTLLAKAVAGEAGVKFKAVSGSDFDEKYVGVGASKMRKLFDDAKNNAPCIIFIDEIDSMGGRRHSKQNSYDRQTLNTLLSEMDGFDGSGGVVVIAATNRIEDLDPALTRPGRFDNHFAVSLPATAKERKIIINLYAGNKKFADDVDMESFAKETMGSSPATIKTVLNEAAIIATRKNKGIITREILDEAWMKQLMEGHLKKNGEKDNVELVAWHEAGHALAGLLMGQDLTKASIIPSTSGAGGATFITPRKLGLFTVKELREQVVMLYSGRNAEAVLAEKNGEDLGITTGASNDIEKATGIIKKMITEYGMNENFGLLNLEELEIKPDVIAKEAVNLSKELCSESYKLMMDNADTLKKIAEALIEKETLTGEEIRKIAGK
ncbi:ATP-dependent metallopeptidase FtsH/Yme1/Tma family protein [Blautia glucerasea]|uniref:ATP-dependent metallopeptidase FtsH/Yme1/Tma family protein n=1 Tax=Blautia TaxID=572511 RepID=UPI00157139A5|nr:MULTISPECIES: FtsH/Yme1/Tma family ATP-dependent metallopeptidase [Blautia]MCB5383060.1 ATP-dependent metallopeptidase FtsH/Yme1/Tma family protein [Blautia glucerasea]NSJ70032.1 AAA family ATPase [Blautia faecis]